MILNFQVKKGSSKNNISGLRILAKDTSNSKSFAVDVPKEKCNNQHHNRERTNKHIPEQL